MRGVDLGCSEPALVDQELGQLPRLELMRTSVGFDVPTGMWGHALLTRITVTVTAEALPREEDGDIAETVALINAGLVRDGQWTAEAAEYLPQLTEAMSDAVWAAARLIDGSGARTETAHAWPSGER